MDQMDRAQPEHEVQRLQLLAIELQAKVDVTEEQLSSLRAGFIALDIEHTSLLQEHQQCVQRLTHVQADNELMEEKLRDALKQSAETADFVGEQTLAEIENELKSLRSENERLRNDLSSSLTTSEAALLRAENNRIKAELNTAHASNASLAAELDSVNQATASSTTDLTSELERQAALLLKAEEERDAALAEQQAEKLRLEAELIKAREEKKMAEQVMARLPFESQRRHQEEVTHLRTELEIRERLLASQAQGRRSDELSRSNVQTRNSAISGSARTQPLSKGTCALCFQMVYSNQKRCRTPHGMYIHESCTSESQKSPVDQDDVTRASEFSDSMGLSLSSMSTQARASNSRKEGDSENSEAQLHELSFADHSSLAASGARMSRGSQI